MGLKTPEINGARQDLPCLESPEVNGARQPIASVKKYVNNAWQEIWSAVKTLIMSQDTTRKYTRIELETGTTYSFKDGSATNFCFMTNEGVFTDVPIQFSCSGFLSRDRSTGTSYGYLCNVEVFGVTDSGEKERISYITVGNTHGTTSHEIDTIATGTFKQIGLNVKVKQFSNSPPYEDNLTFSFIFIDGKKYIA